MKPLRSALAVVLLLVGASARAADKSPDIAFERHRLANGLDVIIHVDHDAPIAHVELWYRVGSKDEQVGKTGFAHLFEHIMFQGTKHVPEDAHFKYLKEAGASNINGTTSFDRTNYFETVPANQLELALWLESSRMGYLLERASFKETLDNQRDVVKNERRQSYENRPMGGVLEVQLAALYPVGHPYQHPVIGSMSDLTAASEGDIRAFFRKYYAPNDAILVIAGDVDPTATMALVEKYFGPIPSGPTPVRPAAAPVKLTSERRIAMEANVKLPTEFMTWHSPARFGEGEAELIVLGRILAGGKSSRLYRRLVYELKLAQNVSAGQDGLLLGGNFDVSFTPLPGHSLAEIERVVDEEMERARTQPVTAQELERVKNQIKTDTFASLESIAARARQLATYTLYANDPGYLPRELARLQAVDAPSLQRAAASWLARDRRLVITVDPNPAAPIMGRIKK